MRKREPGILASSRSRSDSRDHFKWNPGRLQRGGFFTTTPKDVGISAFQTNNNFSRTRLCDQTFIDLLLRNNSGPITTSPRRSFANSASTTQQQGVHKTVIEHEVRSGQTFRSAQSDQPRISGTSSGQIDLTN